MRPPKRMQVSQPGDPEIWITDDRLDEAELFLTPRLVLLAHDAGQCLHSAPLHSTPLNSALPYSTRPLDLSTPPYSLPILSTPPCSSLLLPAPPYSSLFPSTPSTPPHSTPPCAPQEVLPTPLYPSQLLSALLCSGLLCSAPGCYSTSPIPLSYNVGGLRVCPQMGRLREIQVQVKGVDEEIRGEARLLEHPGDLILNGSS